MKKLRLFFLLAIIFFSLAAKAEAVSKTSGDLRVTVEEPMFPSNIIWYPGLLESKSMLVENLASQTQTIYFKANNTIQTGNIADVLFFTVKNDGDTLYGGLNSKTLKNFWDNGETSLLDLTGGSSVTLEVIINMAIAAGNEYQAKSAQFDLIIGFKGKEEVVTVTVVSDAGGVVLGAGVTAPTCSDTAPASAPTLTSVVAGINSVALFWSEGAGPISYYLVAYGTSSGSYTFGNPNIGGKGTTSYTVSNLSGRVPYYFVVRAGNGCAPGPFSNEISATPLGGLVSGPAAGFFPGVLGVATPSAELTGTIVPTGEVAGETVEIIPFPPPGKTTPWGIIFLLLLAGGILVIFLFFRHFRIS